MEVSRSECARCLGTGTNTSTIAGVATSTSAFCLSATTAEWFGHGFDDSGSDWNRCRVLFRTNPGNRGFDTWDNCLESD